MNRVYKVNKNYSARTINGLTVVVPISEECPKFNGMMKLTGIGPYLWSVFEEGASFETVCELIINKYEVSAETAKKDIKDFIESLLTHNLLIEIRE